MIFWTVALGSDKSSLPGVLMLVLVLVGDAMIVLLEGGADVLPKSLSDILEGSSWLRSNARSSVRGVSPLKIHTACAAHEEGSSVNK
jgi:hypothetical protein